MARLLRIIPYTSLCVGLIILYFTAAYYVFGLPGLILYPVFVTLVILWWRGIFHE